MMPALHMLFTLFAFAVATNTTMTRKNSPEYLKSLDATQYTLLALLAVHYAPMGRVPLLAAMRSLGWRNSRGTLISQAELKIHLDAMLDQALIQASNQGVLCPRELTNSLCEMVLKKGRFLDLAEAVKISPNHNPWDGSYSWTYVPFEQYLGFLRCVMYTGNVSQTENLLQLGHQFYSEKAVFHELVNSMDTGNYRDNWFTRLRPEIRLEFLLDRLWVSICQFGSTEHLLGPIKLDLHQQGRPMPGMSIDALLLQGNAKQAKTELKDQTDPESAARFAWATMIEGQWGTAVEEFQLADKLLRKVTRKRNVYFTGMAGVFLAMATLASAGAQQINWLETRLQQACKQQGNPFGYFFQLLLGAIASIQGQSGVFAPDPVLLMQKPLGLDWLLSALILQWSGKLGAEQHLKSVKALQSQAANNGYGWIAAELQQFVARLSGQKPILPAVHIVDAIRPMQDWERALQALSLVGRKPASTTKARSKKVSRLIWLAEYDDSEGLELSPMEQKSTAKGGWSKGQVVSWKRLMEKRSELKFLSSQDQTICAHIKRDSTHRYYGSRRIDYYLELKALPSFVGHPLVFLKNAPSTAVEIVAGTPVLEVAKNKEQLRMTLSPEIDPDVEVMVVRHSPTRFAITEVDEPLSRIANIIGKGLTMPAEAAAGMQAAMAHIAPIVTVQSDLADVATGVEQIKADLRPYLHILPSGEGLTFELFSHPFGLDGPGFSPGQGGKSVYAEVDGSSRHCLRVLAKETANAEAFILACPSLIPCQTDHYCWESEDPESSLEILAECKALDDSSVALIWPRGEQLRVRAVSSVSDMSLRLRQRGEWFEADGELVVDKDLTLGLGQLLKLTQESTSQFLKLGEGEYLALTKTLKHHLDELRSLATNKGKNAQFHHLTAEAIDGIGRDFGSFENDEAWTKQLERLEQARSHRPILPSTLTGELRDYQLQGFMWLSHLSAWGAGACLADDMGLGKTIQALALILTRAPDGPCLVIAPTSVCANWLEECKRFAPTLNPIVYGGNKRQAVIESCGPFDLVICSYGMMQRGSDYLEQKTWQVLVLDEAQAVKNAATKRARSATKLTAEFKIALTGTPIENHLGELWSIFKFLNPGLLGSLESFNSRFAGPIEIDQDPAARNRLKRLLKPFILRRLKTQVLEELPSRTEIILHVELSEAETALYESIRAAAMERLSGKGAEEGRQQFQVLAELTRLRLACCNPALVAPELNLSSTKLELFMRTVDDLIANRHKALVFSQFVKHLTLVRQALDNKGIVYQYLDGSTPAKKRAAIVKAFQAGEGDLFLISLKAGGTGLNLTAADYVIHLDPWWNPAVEDQASDRAHRIGQQRPVTIYKLVAKGTIEDKIVALHQHKRDLANDLLSGTQDSSRLSTEDILDLLKGD